MNKIKTYILALWFQRPIIYTLIPIIIGAMVCFSIVKHMDIAKKQIDFLNREKIGFIEIKKKELQPLMDKKISLESELKELQAKITPLQDCIDWVTKTLDTYDMYNCTPITIIPKAEANSENSEKDYDKLNKYICDVARINERKSPLCDNIELVKELEQISIDKWVDFKLMLGIAYSESHIGANYAPWCDSSYNNLWWIKARKLDNWKTIKDQPMPDKNGCYLYKFWNIKDYWTSKANTLKFGYINKWCSDATCISRRYVRWNWLVKPQWIDRVNVFNNFNF